MSDCPKSRNARRSRARVRSVVLFGCAAWWVLGAGCFSRSPLVTPEQSLEQRSVAEMYVIERAPKHWGYRPLNSRDKRTDFRDGYYLHLGGEASCGGFLRKEQQTHAYAWVTQGSPLGKRVPVKLLNVGFSYKQGLFEGTGASQGAAQQPEVEVHDTISGFSDEICQCVTVYASAQLKGRIFLRTGDNFCPEE